MAAEQNTLVRNGLSEPVATGCATTLCALTVGCDADARALVGGCLATSGYSVVHARSYDECLAHLQAKQVDLVFLEVSPFNNSLDILDWLRCQAMDTAVIVVTGYSSEQLAIDVLRRGADDYLREPFDAADLSAALERTTNRLHVRRRNATQRNQHDEKWHQLESELSNAANVQADLLPVAMPRLAGFDAAAECVPAREVGGDFYDWYQPSPTTVSLWLCDVMGKGMAAALLMATVRAVMRAVVRDSPPGAALRYVTAAIDDDFARTDRFVTLFLAQLDTATNCLRYVDAGHGHAFLLRTNGMVELLRPRGLPLGVLRDVVYEEGRLVFEPGDALVLYSDGLIDARPDLALDPPALGRYLLGARSALAMIDRLVALLGPVGMPPDDMTLFVLRRKDAGLEAESFVDGRAPV